MNTRLLIFLVTLILVVLVLSVPSSAHNISIVKPTKLVVDIGDLMRWLSKNPEANPPDPSVYLTVLIKNASSISINYQLSVVPASTTYTEYITSINCPSGSIYPGSRVIATCTIDLNVVEGNQKLFTGPEINIPLVLEINITDTGGTLLNKYEENVYLIVTDTNDSNWSLIKHFDDSNEPIRVFSISTDSYDETGSACYSITYSSTTYPTESTSCIKSPCYQAIGINSAGEFNISALDLSPYTECILVGYIYQSTLNVSKLITFSSTELNTICHYSSPFVWTATGYRGVALAIPKDTNYIYFLNSSSALGAVFQIDELRIFCR